MAIKSRFEKNESGLYVPKMMRGRVSDIKVYDNFNPLTGEGKLVDYNKGGDNTITSGASWDLLVWAFMSMSMQNQRYSDVNGYLFPSLGDLTSNAGTSASYPPIRYSPAKTLFGGLVGLKGASGGIPAHQTSLSNLQAAWWLQTYAGDSYDLDSGTSVFQIWCGLVTVSTTTSPYYQSNVNNGIPAISLNVTITSQAGALAYTIDSIAWCPMKTNPTSASYYPGYWTLSTGVPNFVSGTAPNVSSQTASPTTLNNLAISALYVLPYSVTVNPNGALQFTYTFQGN